MSENLKRYMVRDGYAYFTGPHTEQKNIHVAGSLLVLSDKQVAAQRQAHKLEEVAALIMRCNNNDCGREFVTEVTVNTTYAVCTHCQGRGGDIVGPVPVSMRANEVAPTDEEKPPKQVVEPKEENTEEPKKDANSSTNSGDGASTVKSGIGKKVGKAIKGKKAKR